MPVPESPDKIIAGGEHGGSGHQNHHNLPCGKAPLHQHMAQQAIACILIVGPNLKRFQHPSDGSDNLVCLLVFQHASVHSHDVVSSLLVDSGDDLPFPVSEGSVNLIAVVKRVVHARDGIDSAKAFQQLLHLLLLAVKLSFIWNIQQLAAAAFFRHRAQAFLSGFFTVLSGSAAFLFPVPLCCPVIFQMLFCFLLFVFHCHFSLSQIIDPCRQRSIRAGPPNRSSWLCSRTGS